MEESRATPGSSRNRRQGSATAGLCNATASLISPPHRQVDRLHQDDRDERRDHGPPIERYLLQHGLLLPGSSGALAFRGLHLEGLLLAEVDEIFGTGMLQQFQ